MTRPAPLPPTLAWVGDANGHLELLDQTAEALYGAGLLGADQLGDVKEARRKKKLRPLSEPPARARQAVVASFGRALEHLTTLEPAARQLPEDRLRRSLVPFYGGVLEGLDR